MKTRNLVATVLFALVSSNAAFAEGSTYIMPTQAPSQTTREAVLAELHANRAQSRAWSSEMSAPRVHNPSSPSSPSSPLSRDDVSDKAAAAVGEGSAQRVGSDDNSFAGWRAAAHKLSTQTAQAKR